MQRVNEGREICYLGLQSSPFSICSRVRIAATMTGDEGGLVNGAALRGCRVYTKDIGS